MRFNLRENLGGQGANVITNEERLPATTICRFEFWQSISSFVRHDEQPVQIEADGKQIDLRKGEIIPRQFIAFGEAAKHLQVIEEVRADPFRRSLRLGRRFDDAPGEGVKPFKVPALVYFALAGDVENAVKQRRFLDTFRIRIRRSRGSGRPVVPRIVAGENPGRWERRVLNNRAALGVPEQIGIRVEHRRRISDMRRTLCFLRQHFQQFLLVQRYLEAPERTAHSINTLERSGPSLVVVGPFRLKKQIQPEFRELRARLGRPPSIRPVVVGKRRAPQRTLVSERLPQGRLGEEESTVEAHFALKHLAGRVHILVSALKLVVERRFVGAFLEFGWDQSNLC
jgi:hypothetical protein